MIGDAAVGEMDNADLYYYLVVTIVYCIDMYLFLIFAYMIVQMHKMRAMLISDSQEELTCKIKSLERRWAIFMAIYLVVSILLMAGWSFI
jgi:hypothetical protein